MIRRVTWTEHNPARFDAHVFIGLTRSHVGTVVMLHVGGHVVRPAWEARSYHEPGAFNCPVVITRHRTRRAAMRNVAYRVRCGFHALSVPDRS